MFELTYSKVGDYYLPNLTLPEDSDDRDIGVCGRRHADYLKNHRKGAFRYPAYFRQAPFLSCRPKRGRDRQAVDDCGADEKSAGNYRGTQSEGYDGMGWGCNQHQGLRRGDYQCGIDLCVKNIEKIYTSAMSCVIMDLRGEVYGFSCNSKICS